LAGVIIATLALGDLVNFLRGDSVRGGIALTIAGTLLFYLLRPEVRAFFERGKVVCPQNRADSQKLLLADSRLKRVPLHAVASSAAVPSSAVKVRRVRPVRTSGRIARGITSRHDKKARERAVMLVKAGRFPGRRLC